MSITASGLTLTWVAIALLLAVDLIIFAVHIRNTRFRRALAAADHEELLEALRDIRNVLADSFGAHEQTAQTLTEIRDREDTP